MTGNRAGLLNRRLTFLTGARVADGQGGYFENAYAAIGTVPNVWASVTPLRGAELVAAQQMHADARYRVTTRWRNDLKATYAVSYPEGDTTAYLAVVAILPRHMEGLLDLDCRAVPASDLGL